MSALIDADLPTSFGTFKPVGHLMVGMPDGPAVARLTARLLEAGWQAPQLRRFEPQNAVAELQQLIDNASGAAGFGSELGLMRRYLALSEQGCTWLLVRVQGSDQADAAAVIARRLGAVLAVYYRSLVVEELI